MGICNGGGRRRTPLGHQKPRITANSQCRPSGGTMPGRRVRVGTHSVLYSLATSTLLLWSVVGHNIMFSPNDSLSTNNCNYLQRYVVKNINLFNGKPFLTLSRPAPLFLTDIISEQYEVKCTDVDGQRGSGTQDLQARHTPEATLSR